MKGGLEELRCIIQDALDELSSPRTSSDVKTRALEQLEKQLAIAYLSNDRSDELKESWDHFLALQYTFECNIPSRLISWISLSTSRLEQIVNKGSPDEQTLASQLSRALSIIQGVVLGHDSCKVFLGRKCSLEILLELLLVSRHLTPAPASECERPSKSTRSKQSTDLPLTSIVLDTLLCVLADSPPALREFEKANGVQAVVKILKRAGTPREVRMKCLEFLYFYLLDETTPTEAASGEQPTSSSSTSSALTPTTTPSHPLSHSRLPKPSLNTTPLRPLLRHGSVSSTSTETSLSSSSSSSRSASGGSTRSFTSISSVSTSTTPASSIPPSPEKPLRPSQSNSRLPSQTPSTYKFPTSQAMPQHNVLMMLKKDVDYEPLSPQKPAFVANSHQRMRSQGHFSTLSRSYTQSSQEAGGNSDGKKTTEDKKKLLGTMLGNVDALVEGVRKAGIWGLA